MKKIVIKLIRGYQLFPSNIHKQCRFVPTCSEYMILSIERFGLTKGIFLGIKRIFKCHPFGKYGYDPVPERKIK